ncbi:MAG: 30S ribosomal protein S5 [Chlorobi bacterium]|nr:30S ribosomal protein S5 [Chlorobiota bacterium]
MAERVQFRKKKRRPIPKISNLTLKERVVNVRRVVKVTKGGRTFRFSALVVVGDQDGVVGYGHGKAREVAAAVEKATDQAKKNLYRVPILQGTVPHDVEAKEMGTRVIIKRAAPGTGVIAGGAMRAVLESAGYTDVIAKVIGSTTPHNVVRATMKALLSLRDPVTIARQRGITLNKLFNG